MNHIPINKDSQLAHPIPNDNRMKSNWGANLDLLGPDANKPIDLEKMKAVMLARGRACVKAAEEHRANLPPEILAYQAKMDREMEEFEAEKKAADQRRQARKHRKDGLNYVHRCERFLKEVARLVDKEGLTDQEARKEARYITAKAKAPVPIEPLGSWSHK
jgi:hypothetical protein